jgi:hypothetical protein
MWCLWLVIQSLQPEQNLRDDGTGTSPQQQRSKDSTTNNNPKLLRRTRMTLSTVDTFLDCNTDRAIKAITTYVQSKVVKEASTAKNDKTKG